MNVAPHTVRLASVTPRVAQSVWQADRCCLTASLGSTHFSGESLVQIVRWVADRFDSCAIVIGDSIYHLTLMAREGVPATVAAARSRDAGDELANRAATVCAQFPRLRSVIMKSSTIAESDSYARDLDHIRRMVSESDALSRAITRDARGFVDRSARVQSMSTSVTREAALAQSREYLLQELAIFSWLLHEEWCVEVYPGPELRVLRDRFRDAPPAFAKMFERRIHVELRLVDGER